MPTEVEKLNTCIRDLQDSLHAADKALAEARSVIDGLTAAIKGMGDYERVWTNGEESNR